VLISALTGTIHTKARYKRFIKGLNCFERDHGYLSKTAWLRLNFDTLVWPPLDRSTMTGAPAIMCTSAAAGKRVVFVERPIMRD
jgi:hypothetical protein